VRITKISVKGLFGMFDHEIPLNQESRITIIHGPNGVGKTVLLRMVHGLFHYEYAFIGSIPFEQIRVDFADGTVLTVQKQLRNEDKENTIKLLIDCIDVSGERQSPFVLAVADTDPMPLLDAVEDMRPDLTAVFVISGDVYWVAEPEKQKAKSKARDFLDLWLSVRPSRLVTKQVLLQWIPQLHSQVYGEMPNWFTNMKAYSRPTLVSIERLRQHFTEEDVVLAKDLYLKGPREDSPIVVFPSMREEAGVLNSYLNRLMADILDYEEYVEQYLQENPEIEQYELLLSEDAVRESSVLTNLLEEKIEELYGDMEPPHHDDFPYIENLLEILNERFLFKSIAYDGDKFVIESDDGSVPLSKLSSGEQHLLIMYYRLLATSPDTLVMIDEPELSMNVVWQRNFLKDLQRIIELRKFDVLIATHSPQIIHDKWDWMVPLGETIDDLDDETD